MEFGFHAKMEEYYKTFVELQEKLKRSEDERLRLEMKFNEMLQVAQEAEQAHYRKLRSQYKRFLEEDKKRQTRNEKIIRNLERVEMRISNLSAKTDRLNMLRHQYQSYLSRVSKQETEDRDSVLFSRPTRFCSVDTTRPLRNPRITSTNPLAETIDITNTPSRRVSIDREKGTSDEQKMEILDRYLQNLSIQKGKDLYREEMETREKLTFSTPHDYATARSNNFDNDHATAIADDIMNSIYSRYYNKNDVLPKATRNVLGENNIDLANKSRHSLHLDDNHKRRDFNKTDTELPETNYRPSTSYSKLADLPATSQISEEYNHKDLLNTVGTASLGDADYNEAPIIETFDQNTTENSEIRNDDLDSKLDDLTQKPEVILEKHDQESNLKEEVISDSNLVNSNKYEMEEEMVETLKSLVVNEGKEEIISAKKESDIEPELNAPVTITQNEKENELVVERSDSLKDELISDKDTKKSVHFTEDTADSKEIPSLLNDDSNSAQLRDPAQQTLHEDGNETQPQSQNIDVTDTTSKFNGDETTKPERVNGEEINLTESDQNPPDETSNPPEQDAQQLQNQIYYDENNQPYDIQGQAVGYDENGQPIQYEDYGQYDQYLYDQNGQPIQPQYDENGQLVPQYDEYGQVVPLFDQHGQQIFGVPYDGQYYTDNKEYESNYQEYDPNQPNKASLNNQEEQGYYTELPVKENVETLQPLNEDASDTLKNLDLINTQDEPLENSETDLKTDENVKHSSDIHDNIESNQNEESGTGQKLNEEKDASETEGGLKLKDIVEDELEAINQKEVVKPSNVLEMLDTDTESVKQSTSKISNDSDFDFS